MEWLLPTGYEGHPAIYILVALAAFLMTGVSKGGFGGVGILAMPLMMMVAPAELALGMWLPLLILCDIFTLRAYPREWKLRPIALLAPGLLLGLVIGWLLLKRVEPWAVKLFVGFLAIGFVGLEWGKAWLRRRLEAWRDRPAWQPNLATAVPFGLAAGISTMIAHAAGAITTIYLLPQRMDKRTFVGTCGRFYFVVNSVKLPFLVDAECITRASLIKSLWLVPLAPLSVYLGAYLNKRLSAGAFTSIIHVLLAISGVYLIYDNIGGVPN